MTRYAIDAVTAIRLVRESVTVAHPLVAPKSLHSDALSILFREVRAGGTSEAEARSVLDGITTTKMRLLGDRVSRATAWKVATALGWEDTPRAEYVAVAQLQADAFVTVDETFARALDGIVALAPFEALSRP
jgi:predicted nucleic acid-binding protein